MPTFIDIGSMDGREISWALEHGYEVHAFEPNIHLKPVLESWENVATINCVAAWDKDGFADLHLMFNPEPGEDGVSLIKEKDNVSPDKILKVPTINTGMYLRRLDKDIDILKINAEGAEYVILESILDHFDSKRIKHWLVEDHLGYISSEEWLDKRRKVLIRLENLGIKLQDYKFRETLEKYV